MKHTDVQKMHEAGLISDDQRQKIIAHFQLKEEGGKFLAVRASLKQVLVDGNPCVEAMKESAYRQ